jgi:hypothetical protein
MVSAMQEKKSRDIFEILFDPFHIPTILKKRYDLNIEHIEQTKDKNQADHFLLSVFTKSTLHYRHCKKKK